jgi:hypothetical protein
MKVFIRSDDLTNERPIIIEYYPDGSEVQDNAHGEGMTVLTVPKDVIQSQGKAGVDGRNIGPPALVSNWRQHVGSRPIDAEAEKRINEVFTQTEQISALHEIIDAMINHGIDSTNWPENLKVRRAEIEAQFEYVKAVKESARAHATSIPLNPGSDKIWPRRITKMK